MSYMQLMNVYHNVTLSLCHCIAHYLITFYCHASLHISEPFKLLTTYIQFTCKEKYVILLFLSKMIALFDIMTKCIHTVNLLFYF